MGWGFVSGYGAGSLMTSFSGKAFQQAVLNYITTAPLHSGRAWVLNSPDLSPRENIWWHEMKNMIKSQDCWKARILNQTRMGRHSSPKSPAAAPLGSQTSTTVVRKKRKCKHGPLLPSNSKRVNIFLTFVHFSQFDIFSVLLWIKYGLMRFANHCTLFLFTFCTATQLFWKWDVYEVSYIYAKHHAGTKTVLGGIIKQLVMIKRLLRHLEGDSVHFMRLGESHHDMFLGRTTLEPCSEPWAKR